jgi:hypothetical protein
MHQKRGFTITSLIVVLLVNGAMVATFYFLTPEPYSIQSGMMLGIAGLLTMLLWFIIIWIGGRAIDAATARTLAAIPTAPPSAEPAVTSGKVPPAPKSESTPRPEPIPEPVAAKTPDEISAIQVLAILQRKGRLIDFLQEDLSAYEDAQIGAAVRTIHEGCNEALAETVKLEPVFQEAEGSNVTIQAGFDSHAIRLVGSVLEEPPFKGVLRHKGWRAASITLPERTGERDDEMIIAAAEVEV